MKKTTSVLAFLAISFFCLQATAQKVKTESGNADILKAETSINFEFTYDNISVGKYKNEQDYIKDKTAEYNKKEPGRGDTWAKSWISDRESRYEPKFIELFKINSGMTEDRHAKYTLIFKTISIEPGYNIAISRKSAQLDAEVWIVETANRNNKVATLTISNVPGGTPFGYDFDTGLRISEAYANSGKKLANYLK
jgi:hypothetical protein